MVMTNMLNPFEHFQFNLGDRVMFHDRGQLNPHYGTVIARRIEERIDHVNRRSFSVEAYEVRWDNEFSIKSAFKTTYYNRSQLIRTNKPKPDTAHSHFVDIVFKPKGAY